MPQYTSSFRLARGILQCIYSEAHRPLSTPSPQNYSPPFRIHHHPENPPKMHPATIISLALLLILTPSSALAFPFLQNPRLPIFVPAAAPPTPLLPGPQHHRLFARDDACPAALTPFPRAPEPWEAMRHEEKRQVLPGLTKPHTTLEWVAVKETSTPGKWAVGPTSAASAGASGAVGSKGA
ncbi:hypothetical protein BDY21DRAFT_424787 [Lineolata rhizophorae]|uniref:Uncharacterized protein n=1 Tax=Lineolata rhizophorae TaxID=578093 RepID=A0A6A6NMC8_9PEZI|nr:hypothetical protein BDY21DRAFT_424787 [Lineolata rhizophorae]